MYTYIPSLLDLPAPSHPKDTTCLSTVLLSALHCSPACLLLSLPSPPRRKNLLLHLIPGRGKRDPSWLLFTWARVYWALEILLDLESSEDPDYDAKKVVEEKGVGAGLGLIEKTQPCHV